MGATFKIDVSKVVAEIASGSKTFIAAIQRGMKQGALQWIGEEVKAEMRGRPGLINQTSNLARSWFVSDMGWGGRYILKVGTPVKYARIHQHGGTVKPKNSRYLTIPLTREAKTRRASDFPDAFVIRSQAGNLVIVRNTLAGKRGKLQALYVLKKSVTIPKRLHVYENWRESAWTYMDARITAEIFKEAKLLSRGSK